MDPQAFVTALPATGPHPNHERELMLFGRFVGEWRVRIHMIQDGEIRYDEEGFWTFAWVLDGRAIQDVLVAPNYATKSDEVGERSIGTTVRYFNPASGEWDVVWFGATTGVVARLTGRAVGDEVWTRPRMTVFTSAGSLRTSLTTPSTGKGWPQRTQAARGLSCRRCLPSEMYRRSEPSPITI